MKTNNTVDYKDWVNDKKNKKPKEKYKKIVHQIFFECLNYIDDDFWKHKFKKMSYGHFPTSFFYKDETLYKKKKNKLFYQKISKDPKIAYHEIKQFLHEHGNIYSCNDYKKIEELTKEDESNGNYDNYEWKNYKLIYKNSMLYKYVKKLAKEYNLSNEKRNNLIYQIKLAIQLKKLENDDFKIKNHNIVKINKLKHDEDYNFYIDADLNKSKISKSNKKLEQVYTIYNLYDSDYNLSFTKNLNKYLNF